MDSANACLPAHAGNASKAARRPPRNLSVLYPDTGRGIGPLGRFSEGGEEAAAAVRFTLARGDRDTRRPTRPYEV